MPMPTNGHAERGAPPHDDNAPLTRRSPRFDVFGTAHKMLRYVLAETTKRLGRTAWRDAEQTREALSLLNDALEMCSRHLGYEEVILFPALRARLSNALTCTAEHSAQPRTSAELEAMATAVRHAAPEKKALVGRTLYLHFTRFTSELLRHMAEEEQVGQSLFERHFTDEELHALHARVIGSIDEADLARSASWMFRAIDADERVEVLMGMLALAPREKVAALFEHVRPTLTPPELEDLLARASFTP